MHCVLEGAIPHAELSLIVPMRHDTLTLQTIQLNHTPVEIVPITRYGKPCAEVSLGMLQGELVLTARYGTG